MFFFFGTLMDVDVLARVLGRPVAHHELAFAEIDHFRRVRARHASYPVLVPARGAVVQGRLLRPRHALEEARIAWFEEEEYAERQWPVRRPDGRRVEARVFLGLPALGTTHDEWRYEDWAREEKAGFLQRCEAWLAECPIPVPG